MLELEEEVILPDVTPSDYIPVHTNYPSCEKAYIIGWMDSE